MYFDPARHPSLSKEHALYKPGLGRDYLPLWSKKRNYVQPKPPSDTPFLVMVGLFRATPFSQRKVLYSNGEWMRTVAPYDLHVALNFAPLDVLPDVSNTHSPRPTFKYITNETAHMPWGLDIDTGLPMPKEAAPAWEKRFEELGEQTPKHMGNAYCALRALAAWFQWMKDHNVYDNTQIILVSDHSYITRAQIQDLLPPVENRFPPAPHALLLVKNAHERGALRIDDYPMMNSDVPALICSELMKAGGQCGNIAPFAKGDPTQRIRWHDTLDRTKSILSNSMNTYARHRVTGSMFKKENWERVQ